MKEQLDENRDCTCQEETPDRSTRKEGRETLMDQARFNVLRCQIEDEKCPCEEDEPAPSPGIPGQTDQSRSRNQIKEVKPQNGKYRQRMNKRIGRMEALKADLEKSQALDRAQFFLKGEAPFHEYRRLIYTLLEEAETLKGQNNAYAKLANYATSHLLDKSIERTEQGLEPFPDSDFVDLIRKMKEQGLSNSSLVRSWNKKPLYTYFSEEVVEKFAKLLNS